MIFTKEEIRNLYRKRAEHYDLTANLYYLIGVREQFYREEAVKALALHRGNTVIEIGCGTGLNFPLLQQFVGPEGKIIGVDLSDAMLERAENRVRHCGWQNVELAQSDASEYEFPKSVDGIISTFALTLSPEFDSIIQSGSKVLKRGGRFVVVDLKMPERWPAWLVRLGVHLTRPFGVTLVLTERHPWESIKRHLREVAYTEYYYGAIYISAGEASEKQS